ncbi:hypothetical protein [Chryseosolibacter indicus]|uniref:Uncharacterized protein n=1 Tax=Chryseosolibacter indicus TaxID=2782351 RepID=A0ABS5VUP4_9BACT|nr:hypothetical protein [Chryseosolibacter indicus]MBT1704542.1 hypothetical protein [Chryseosolibacter indicus]
MRNIYIVLLFVFLFTQAHAQGKSTRFFSKKKYQYEQVDLENMMRRYFLKESTHAVEGIYSVSCVISKTGKGLLSSQEKSKIVERKENYARVAIMKDRMGTKRDFIEVSLSYKDDKKYPIVGDLNSIAEGKGFIYHHTEPSGEVINFSMVNESPELIEGEYSVVKRQKTITYKLSYIKIFPKGESIVIND